MFNKYFSPLYDSTVFLITTLQCTVHSSDRWCILQAYIHLSLALLNFCSAPLNKIILSMFSKHKTKLNLTLDLWA